MPGIDFNEVFDRIDIIDFTMKAAVIIGILVATVLCAKLARKFVQNNIDKGRIDVTQLSFIKHFLTGTIYFIGLTLVIFQIGYLKSIAVSILASSGILAIIIGFASQQTFANLVSGLFISFFKPFRIGDRIRFIDRDTMGIVEDITLRHTVIRSYENKRIIIPNNVINNEMIENANIIEEKTCNYFNIGISYDSDIDQAINIIKDEALSHKDFFDNRTKEEIKNGEEPVVIKVVSFGDSSVNLKAWVWTGDPLSGFLMICDLNKSVKERFDREGIEIPFPYRTIVFKNKDEEKIT
ncbi:MAG: mechanosensitive ion channel protein MscS [Gracilibacter sp. BRH_c7a]|nr:MAG: mechanosensitive ion channel protein MscS [Gracilibacter sp. BRH_c7a]